jgi:hypothetical protein
MLRELRAVTRHRRSPWEGCSINGQRRKAAATLCRYKGRSLRGFESGDEAAKGVASVAMLIFFGGIQLREGFAAFGEVEDRIIAETTGATRDFEDFPVHFAGNDS